MKADQQEGNAPMKVLVTGGARSGKSGFAEKYAAVLGHEGLYVATAQAYDDEMRRRIDLHRQSRSERGFRWTTAEEPFALAELLERSTAPVVLVDCLTLWLSNWLLRLEQEPDAEAQLEAKIDSLAAIFAAAKQPTVLVTNEVGAGLVPEYKLGRIFRDLSGRMNQRLAREADQVFLVASGIPLELKSMAFKL
ncbi:bifunctional adenosylcobinamide kinase/adenosylcobinamide-phosphate guanylyltransferase [Paenibacillus elgii]|uniref:bifunctional adenosylcobinamide kinase/adenosylcobinamide-phosphate guanylyltransferase n=1 Tax=Paenibacillus elgii TaxID=189691 RepID=UPI0020422326|nr:bifunctional adenosylcobinamide kinase/adenosylcobinamide-phosphate guanylyltransferase [Paenibacillus elgii]MCM3268225.1 bifunctional adenosylcobinamide kinase/adenosylcobinamide-phosphate guanylyltransferase [Paenibacillus elgii]